MSHTSNIRDSFTFDISELNREVAELLVLFELTSTRITKPDKPESFYRIMDSLLVLEKCQEYTAAIDENPLTFQTMTSDELFLYKRAKAILAVVNSSLPTTMENAEIEPSEIIHPLPRARPIRSRRARILLVATLVLLFSLSAVGVASQPFVREIIQKKSGNATTIHSGDIEVYDIELDYSSEEDAYIKAEDYLGISILRFPDVEDYKFLQAEINDTQQSSLIFYTCGTNILQLDISCNHSESHYITNELPLRESSYQLDGTTILLTCFENYTEASFCYNSVFYTFTGTFSETDFITIIEQMIN